MAANCYRYGWVHQRWSANARVDYFEVMRWDSLFLVKLSLRLLGFFLKFAGISTTTSPSWFDIYTYTCILLSCLPCFFVKNGLHLPTKAETDIMDHIIRSFFKDKLTATYCKHNDANYPMMEYVFKSISWSSFLLESTNCVFPSQKKTSTVFCINKTQAEKKKKKNRNKKKCHHHIIHPHLIIPSSIPTWLLPSSSTTWQRHWLYFFGFGFPVSFVSYFCPGLRTSAVKSGISGPFPFFLKVEMTWSSMIWFKGLGMVYIWVYYGLDLFRLCNDIIY